MRYPKNIGHVLDTARQKFAELPVVVITETLDNSYLGVDVYGQPFLNETQVTVIDLAKIRPDENGDDYDYEYVDHILMAAVEGKSTFITTPKHSFMDTPVWWIGAQAEDVQGRTLLHIRVLVQQPT